jgi:uncharacterized protein with HEPN domain
MRRDPRSFLWDVCNAADAIASFVHGRSFGDYSTDRMLRSAVERQFEIIGEALSQLARPVQAWPGAFPISAVSSTFATH